MRFTVFAALFLLSLNSAQAQLTVYDGFDTTLSDGVVFTGASAVGATSIGFQSGTNWSLTNSSAGVNRISFTTTGLSLGGLLNTGGAVRVRPIVDSGFPDGSFVSVSRPIAEATSTFFTSYLFRNEGAYSQFGVTDVILGGNTDTSGKIALSPKEYDQAAGFGSTRINNQNQSPVNGPNATNVDETYIMIAKVTAGTDTTVKNWVLSASQFDAFKAAGSTETYLDTVGNVTQSGTNTRTGYNATLNAGDNISLFGYNNQTTVFDEFRIGASLIDVTPVPEPMMLITVTGLLLAARRRVLA
jgi:hypothetical protein